MKNSQKLSLKEMPFYSEMEIVQNHLGVDERTALQFQIGFKATPNMCGCGNHEWSIFDMIIESVSQKRHDWEFYKNPAFTQGIPTFFVSQIDLTCPACKQLSQNLQLRYTYGGHIYQTDPDA